MKVLKDRMVCECYDITVDKIKQALLDGAKGYDDLVKSMRLGVLCSACIGDAKKVVEQLQIEIEEEKIEVRCESRTSIFMVNYFVIILFTALAIALNELFAMFELVPIPK